jgi:Zn-dependent alcohol dehydrogenase
VTRDVTLESSAINLETTMDVRAAVAYASGKPLVVETVQLAGPKSGEVLVELNDINKAFDLMHSGESIRSVVVY